MKRILDRGSAKMFNQHRAACVLGQLSWNREREKEGEKGVGGKERGRGREREEF